MMGWITDLDALHAAYGTPGQAALKKQTARLTPAYGAPATFAMMMNAF